MAPAIDDPHNARSRRTRDALLAATREILENDGFEALTMAEVAARAGVSRRAVYLHFRSRTDLVTELSGFVAEQEGLAESLAGIWEAADAAEALRAWVRHLTRYHPRLSAMNQALDRVGPYDADAARHKRTIADAQMDNCRRIAGRLADEGRLAAPWTAETAADMLWSLISTDLFDRIMVDRGWSRERVERHLVALYESAFVR
ncbi:TetR/AcrR family transcriptional regulator [Nonomuraea sp. K274]|uniref:TetR/AcrR family transcriptional regulator n=1 Tax=Nonomuraea cypriaca TaxID=1187855 RepID=A0A931A4I6_9ACTN|nr:TetR/AcrR family transcriptional regulator [Nonomuraea cypriaca]MBF8186061.1 TetR/AcrR family transcriptional regulator [Nonomuraea cypriaca]